MNFADGNEKYTDRKDICITTSNCSKFGDTSYSGKSPNDPNDVKCCDDIPCAIDNGKKGNCVFSDNVMVKKLVENVQEIMISNAA